MTTVHRDAYGYARSIEAPFGQTTLLGLDGANLPEAIAAPDGATWRMTYHTGAQVATFTTPRSETSHLTYDDWGRVEHERSPDGSSHHFARAGMHARRSRPSSGPTRGSA